GAFFNAEFGIGHRGNTVPERSGVALSFCGRPFFGINHLFIPLHGSLSVSSTRFSLVALRYYSAFFMSTHKKPDLNPSRSGFLSHLALLQRRIIDIPLRPLTIEGREIRLVERRVLCETLHQIWVGDEGNAEGHRIALASGQPFIGLPLG